jgi:hypothetical protein
MCPKHTRTPTRNYGTLTACDDRGWGGKVLVISPYIECYISTSKSVAVAEQPPIMSICQGLITQLPTRNI